LIAAPENCTSEHAASGLDIRHAPVAQFQKSYYLTAGESALLIMTSGRKGDEVAEGGPLRQDPSTEDLYAEIDKCVREGNEFVKRFKDLAAQLALPPDDSSFQILTEAETLLLEHSEIARRFASRMKENSLSELKKAEIRDALAAATRQIRRASLLLQVQIFRLDKMVDRPLASRTDK
jgi:hypothetical protein